MALGINPCSTDAAAAALDIVLTLLLILWVER